MRILLFGFLIFTASCNSSPSKVSKEKKPKKVADVAKEEDKIQREDGPRITFQVDDVALVKSPLADTSFKVIFENTVNREIFAYPEELEKYEYADHGMNGFLAAVHHAYSAHRPLEISPDDVWLLISQGFGHHLLVNADELEDVVLKPNHPDAIVVREDGLKKDDPESWKRLIAGFTKGVESHAKGNIVDLVAPHFSTTTPIISTAYQATVLDGMKTYFQYIGESGCGIPSVTLRGTEEDWQKIYNDIDQFKEFGMEEWVDGLKPVLKEFLNAYQGNPDIAFWQSIYKDVSMYGESYISGWVIKFFPYIEYETQEGESSWESEVAFSTHYKPNPFVSGDRYLLSTLNTSDIPKGYVELNFVWNENKENGETTKHDMLLYAGFFGIYQDRDTKTVAPNIGWAICKDGQTNYTPAKVPRTKWDSEERQSHKIIGWVAPIQDSVENMPIYHKSVNSTIEDSKFEISDYLMKNGIESWEGGEIIFIIAHNGTLIFEEVTNDTLEQGDQIKKLLTQLPHKWEAGTSVELNGLDLREEDYGPIPVNVRITIRI